MTNEEAIKYLQVMIESEISKPYPFGLRIDSMQTAINALEKQIPKKPKETVQITDDEFTFMCCNCGRATSIFHDLKIEYCPHCGQALDWSNE